MLEEQKILVLDSGMLNPTDPFCLPHQKLTKPRNRDIRVVYDGNALRIVIGRHDILDFDAVMAFNWIRDRCLFSVVARHLKRHDVPFLFRDMINLRSKLTDLEMFAAAGIRYPRTFYASRGFYDTDIERGMTDLNLEFPIIIKHVMGWAGHNNFRVNSRDEAFDVIKKSNGLISKRLDGGYLVQEYIKNELHDYRVVIVDAKPVLVVKRQRANDVYHTNNISDGATGSFLTLDESEAIWRPAVEAAKAVEREDCTGVDLVVDQQTGLTYVLEANEFPSLLDMHLEEKIPPIYRYIDGLIRAKHAAH